MDRHLLHHPAAVTGDNGHVTGVGRDHHRALAGVEPRLGFGRFALEAPELVFGVAHQSREGGGVHGVAYRLQLLKPLAELDDTNRGFHTSASSKPTDS